MRAWKRLALATVLALGIDEGIACAQSVAYFPVVGTIPDGVIMTVTPVVSADRRYVRLATNPNLIAFGQFDTFPIPGAVGGGPSGPGALGGLGLGGGLGGQNAVGGLGGGFRQMGLGPNPFDPLFADPGAWPDPLSVDRPQAERDRPQPPRQQKARAAARNPKGRIAPSPSTLIRAGESLEKAGKPWAAVENYRRVLREYPAGPWARIAEKKLNDSRRAIR